MFEIINKRYIMCDLSKAVQYDKSFQGYRMAAPNMWVAEIKARSWNLQRRFQMGLEVWFRAILSLGFSIFFQEFWNWGLAVLQGLEFTILYPSFWLANSFVVDCTQEAFSLFTKS